MPGTSCNRLTPRLRVYLVEDGAAYFQPNWDLYGGQRLKPLLSRWCRKEDLLQGAIQTASRYGIELSAWNVCLHNTPLGTQFPECAIHNVFGDPYFHALSPGHPEARSYVKTVVRDLSRYGLRSILLEAPDYRNRAHGANWVSGHHHERAGVHLRPLEECLLSLSFNPEDVHAAQQAGVDMERLRERVLDHLERYFREAPKTPAELSDSTEVFRQQCPELGGYERYRRNTVRAFIAELKQVAAKTGLELDGVEDPSIDTVLVGAFGKAPHQIDQLVKDTRSRLKAGQKLMVLLRMGFNSPGFGPSISSQKEMGDYLRSALDAGADIIGLYNYSEAPPRTLTWIGPNLRELLPAVPAKPSPIAVGLIGCGRYGRFHARAYAGIPEVRLAGCTDTDSRVAEEFSREEGVDAVDRNTEQLLGRKEIRLVSIVVPHRFHRKLLLAALKQGKDVWIEKPPGLRLQETETLLAAARASNSLVAVGLSHRYSPGHWMLRDLIRKGLVGQLRSIRILAGTNKYVDPRWRDPRNTPGGWFLDPEMAGGGILPSSTIHLLSVASWLLQDRPFLQVRARVSQLHPQAHAGIEDDVELEIEDEPGVTIQVADSWVHELGFRLDVVGTNGRLGLRGDLSSPDLSGELQDIPPEWRHRALKGKVQIRHEQMAGHKKPGALGLASDLIESLRTGRRHPDLPDLLHARNLMATIQAAYSSASSGRPERVNWKSG